MRRLADHPLRRSLMPLAGVLLVVLTAGSLLTVVHGATPDAFRPPALSSTASPMPSVLLPRPGASSAGDPFYPTLGNGGYDTSEIDLVITWTPPGRGAPDGRAELTTTIDAIAAQDLSSLTLDLSAATTIVRSVSVDGTDAAHAPDAAGRKLIVTLPQPVADGQSFRVVVASEAIPGVVQRTGEDGSFERPGLDPDEVRIDEGRGLIADGAGGVLLAAQPNGAHTLFPVNDHPTDKALTRVTITAPPGMLGVATGDLERLAVGEDGALTTVWSSGRPVASHVLALAVGRYVLRTGVGPDGVALRSVVPRDEEAQTGPTLSALPGVLAWLEQAIGAPYPFGTFGLVAYPGRPTTAILEGQTLVLMPSSFLDARGDRCRALGALVHEAAHQWFGNLVSISTWDAKWLSEGHATYYEWRWLAEHGCLAADPEPAPSADPDAADAADAADTDPDTDTNAGDADLDADPSVDADTDPAAAFDARVRRAYEAAGAVRATWGPPGAPRDPSAAYTSAIYDGGALALDALRREVGDAVFGRIERNLLRRYRDRAASTDDFIAVASRTARRDLAPFLGAWLNEPALPAMPGHPGWTSGRPVASSEPSFSPAP